MEVLVAVGNKTLAVTQIEKPVIGEGMAGHFVDGEVGDDDAQVVLSRCTACEMES